MKRALLCTIAGVGLLTCGMGIGSAQDRDRDRDDGWYQHRDSFYREGHWRGRLFERVRDDLDHVQSTTFPVSTDEFRIVRTKQELGELQEKLAGGRYDQPELDQVIAAMQRVVNSNKLSPRDRDMLNDDLSRMREYREHHENWDRR